jgi:hypothetical protein
VREVPGARHPGVTDPNLRLALIDEVYRHRDGSSWVSALRERFPRIGELEHDDNEHVPELEQLLATLELSQDALARITSLTLDGDRDLYSWVYPNWWDFGDHFAIHDLAGIEQCVALDYLLLGQGLVSHASLAPLAKLPALRELHLCALCDYRDLDALLAIETLAKLDVVNVGSNAAWRALLAQLSARGVAVPAR